MAADKDREPGSTSAEIGKYLDILAKDPNSRVFAPLAEAYRKAGLLDDAVEIALEGLKLHPNYLGGRVALGRAYFEKHQFADAAAEMQKVARSAPDNIIAHKVLGQIALAQGDLSAAEKAFKMVLLLDPRDAEAKQFIEKPAAPPPPVAAPVAPAPPAPQAPEEWSLAQEPLVEDAPAASAAAPEQPPAAAATHPYEDIPAIDDLELHVDDIFGAPEPREPASAAAALETRVETAAPPAPPAVQTPVAAPSAAPSVAPPPPVQKQEQATGAMELEVFARVPWSSGGASTPAANAAPQPAAAQPPEPGDADSPFETFGRRSFEAAPASAKGDREAFGEIDLESTASAPEPAPPEPTADEPLFEVFTRQPAISQPPPPSKSERPRTGGPRELVVETTAYTPPESYAADEMETPLISLDEELPRIDLTQELDFGSLEPEGLPIEAAVEPPPAQVEIEPLATTDGALEEEGEAAVPLRAGAEPPEDYRESAPAPVEVLEPEPDWGGAPERQAEPDGLPVYHLQEEIPAIDLAPDDNLDPFGEEPEVVAPEREPDVAPPGAPAGRGVFDTETLASIYVSQGFFRRAAEIYERLIQQRPDDQDLRGKLEDVLSRERGAGDAGSSAPVAAVPPAPAPVPAPAAPVAPKAAGSEQVIVQLQTLLEALKGGRP
jgi:tetratricopeptide (TPR) repeat protein